MLARTELACDHSHSSKAMICNMHCVCSCWDVSPHGRPTFGQIAQCLEIMLEEQDSNPLTLQATPAQISDVWVEEDQEGGSALQHRYAWHRQLSSGTTEPSPLDRLICDWQRAHEAASLPQHILRHRLLKAVCPATLICQQVACRY